MLLDLGLPDAEGLEAVRRVHAVAPQIPLVVLTILDDESMALRALQEGAQDYLIKGQIESGLLRALRYAIERKIMEGVLVAERTRSEEGWARLAAIRLTAVFVRGPKPLVEVAGGGHHSTTPTSSLRQRDGHTARGRETGQLGSESGRRPGRPRKHID